MSIRRMIFASLLAAGTAATAYADAELSLAPSSISLRPLVGAYIPSGAQHRELSSSILTGAELGYALPMPMRLVGSVTWTPSRDRRLSNERFSILQYDAGAEWAPGQRAGDGWQWSPFIGAGLGVRSYRSKQQDLLPTQSDLAGYGSLGGELDRSGFGWRAELRDYVSRFKEPPATQKTTRNDLMLTAALTIHM